MRSMRSMRGGFIFRNRGPESVFYQSTCGSHQRYQRHTLQYVNPAPVQCGFAFFFSLMWNLVLVLANFLAVSGQNFETSVSEAFDSRVTRTIRWHHRKTFSSCANR